MYFETPHIETKSFGVANINELVNNNPNNVYIESFALGIFKKNKILNINDRVIKDYKKLCSITAQYLHKVNEALDFYYGQNVDVFTKHTSIDDVLSNIDYGNEDIFSFPTYNEGSIYELLGHIISSYDTRTVNSITLEEFLVLKKNIDVLYDEAINAKLIDRISTSLVQ